MRGFRKLSTLAGVLLVLSVVSAFAAPVYAQEGGNAETNKPFAYAGAAIGVGLVVIGAAMGIGRFAAAAAEAIARQPQAAAQITGAVQLPLFLLEGAAIIAEVVCLLIVLMK